jgi:hypothetical protein
MQTQSARNLALGRYWGSADVATLVEYDLGDAQITFEWNDGASLTVCEETHADARKTLARLGYL